MFRELNTCMQCGNHLNDYEDFAPVRIPGKGELCADCYKELNELQRLRDFRSL